MPASKKQWGAPVPSRGAVDRAGKVLAGDGVDRDSPRSGPALEVLANWRSAHSVPLNAIQETLRKRVRKVCPEPLEPTVAQRFKRLQSIVNKLRRFSSMKLSRMQDIGGTRIVLPTVDAVDALFEVYQSGRMKRNLVNHKDYIREPKSSGYRGIHLVYGYTSDKNPAYNGLRVEIQIRTELQHAWATTVESVGTLIGQSLKSSAGLAEWLRFFELMGAAFAGMEGGSASGSATGADDVQIGEIKTLVQQLEVRKTLAGLNGALDVTNHGALSGFQYVLLVLLPDRDELQVHPYLESELEQATEAYLKQEEALASTTGNTVLVRTASLESLRREFPNYFLDTRAFASHLERLVA